MLSITRSLSVLFSKSLFVFLFFFCWPLYFRNISLHHGSVFILINKTTILPHKYFFVLIYVYSSAFQRFNDIVPFNAFDFFSPLSTVSMFVSFDQKIECSPLLITNVKKEITSFWPKSNIFYRYLSLL